MAYEDAENKAKAQQRLDMELTREELLEELCRCRLVMNGPTVNVSVFRADAQEQQQQQQRQRVKSEARMTEDFAAALEEAFTIMDALQVEKDAVLLEKKTREVSYEAELRIRVAETEGLTATLQELRGTGKPIEEASFFAWFVAAVRVGG
ncbi:hypothetical protein TcCL_Unassigned06969 [Trypanosoma cruzi]|nr:hypothetical protein TcCL_Unassigned06969 [Trypanosoma cruzi]